MQIMGDKSEQPYKAIFDSSVGLHSTLYTNSSKGVPHESSIQTNKQTNQRPLFQIA